jgi:thiamine pyrophosphokinase
MKALIVLQGGGFVRDTEDFDLVICADSGIIPLMESSRWPDLLVGDLDSLSSEHIKRIKEAGVEIIAYSPDKDRTDGEIALKTALDRGATTVVLAGGVNGRIDHIYSSFHLLFRIPEGIESELRFGPDIVYLLRGGEELTVRNHGSVISVIPATEGSVVTESGFKWELISEPLPLGSTRGIHNELKRETGRISVKRGNVFVMLCRDRSQYKSRSMAEE